MPFSKPPNYDEQQGRIDDFINRHVIVEPISRKTVETKFKDDAGNAKEADCWEVIVWTPEGDALEPHDGMLVFQRALVGALDIAHKTGNPVAGLLVRGKGQMKYQLVDGRPEDMALLGKLWEALAAGGGDHKPRKPATVPATGEDEEPF